MRRRVAGAVLLLAVSFSVGTSSAASAPAHDAAWHLRYPLQCHMASDRTAPPS
ncbi:MAG: hypothetical protein ACRDPI_06890 [Nocardioidaceae bacterium]